MLGAHLIKLQGKYREIVRYNVRNWFMLMEIRERMFLW
jgi:hypothetical protein